MELIFFKTIIQVSVIILIILFLKKLFLLKIFHNLKLQKLSSIMSYVSLKKALVNHVLTINKIISYNVYKGSLTRKWYKL